MTEDAAFKSLLSARQRFAKRALDLSVAVVGLTMLWPLIGLGWIVAFLDTRSSGFFRQTRIGRYGVPFRIVKLRTMREVASIRTAVTTANDFRITRIGRALRRFKLDELPQLWNVLRGEMSVVGPRPDVPGFADRLEGEQRAILAVRPGITGPASLAFRDEEELLAERSDPERYNTEILFPQKVAINLEYLENYSFGCDLSIILETLFPSLAHKP